MSGFNGKLTQPRPSRLPAWSGRADVNARWGTIAQPFSSPTLAPALCQQESKGKQLPRAGCERETSNPPLFEKHRLAAMVAIGWALAGWALPAGAAERAVSARMQSPGSPAPTAWNQPISNPAEIGGAYPQTPYPHSPYPQTPYQGTSAPQAPQPMVYPGGGPTTLAAPTPVGDAVPSPAAGPPITTHTFEDAQIVARVGNEVILAGEVMALVHQELYRRGARLSHQELQSQRMAAIQTMLGQLIETKLVYNDALRAIPPENMSKIQEKVSEQFDKTQIPKLMAEMKVESRAELDARLNELGMPLEYHRQAFLERSLAMQWLRQHVNYDEEIPHARMLAYYQEHLADYEFGAQARWEELAVRFDRFDSKEAAWRAIAEMGNEVLRGRLFSEVAQEKSHGFSATAGGQRDWTTKGSLRSQALDQALFSLPIGRLSQILEDETSFYIVRVLERKEAGRTPFTEAQSEIRKKLREENVRKQVEEYLSKTRENTPVWTIFDQQDAPLPSTTTAQPAVPAGGGRF
jgi:parvulin-like peptidyl-prolyl isomerase